MKDYFVMALGEQHLPAVMTIEELAFTHPWSLQNFKDSLRSGSFGMIMGKDKDWLGYCVLMPVLDEIHILNFAIHPKLQHQGYGKKLLHEIVTLAQEKHFKDIFLEVRESNHPAHQLYWHAGFHEIGRRKGYYPRVGGREDAIVMRKEL